MQRNKYLWPEIKPKVLEYNTKNTYIEKFDNLDFVKRMRRQDIHWGKTLASTSLTKDLDPEYMRYSQNSTGNK